MALQLLGPMPTTSVNIPVNSPSMPTMPFGMRRGFSLGMNPAYQQQRMENEQLRGLLTQLKIAEQQQKLAAGGAKNVPTLLEQQRLVSAFNDLMSNQAFRERAAKIPDMSPSTRLKELDRFKREFLEPLHTQYNINTQTLYNHILAPMANRSKVEQERIDDTAWEAIPKSLRISGNNLWATIKNILPNTDEEQIARERDEANRAIIESSPYLQDQQRRIQEGQGIFERTNGLAGWLNMAAENAPTLAAFLAPGGLVGLAGRAAAAGVPVLRGASALTDAVKLAQTARRANVIGGAGLGGSMASIDYTSSILNDTDLSDAEKQAAIHSPERWGVRAIGTLTGAIAPDFMGTVRAVSRMTNPVYRSLDKAGREAFTRAAATRQLVNASRQGVAEGMLRNAVNVGTGMGLMSSGQTLATNALRNSAANQNRPITEGAGDAFISGAITGGLLGAGARAVSRVPSLRDDGTRIYSPREAAWHYKFDPEANKEKIITDLARDYKNDSTVLQRLHDELGGIATPDELQQIDTWYNGVQAAPSAADAAVQQGTVTTPTAKMQHSVNEMFKSEKDLKKLFAPKAKGDIPGEAVLDEAFDSFMRRNIKDPTEAAALIKQVEEAFNERSGKYPASKAQAITDLLARARSRYDIREVVQPDGQGNANKTPGDNTAVDSRMATDSPANAAAATPGSIEQATGSDSATAGRGDGGTPPPNLGQNEADLSITPETPNVATVGSTGSTGKDTAGGGTPDASAGKPDAATVGGDGNEQPAATAGGADTGSAIRKLQDGLYRDYIAPGRKTSAFDIQSKFVNYTNRLPADQGSAVLADYRNGIQDVLAQGVSKGFAPRYAAVQAIAKNAASGNAAQLADLARHLGLPDGAGRDAIIDKFLEPLLNDPRFRNDVKKLTVCP